MQNDICTEYYICTNKASAAYRLFDRFDPDAISMAYGNISNLLNNPSNQPDEIRNLEYEYDLMDKVTQRQNHISGLSESFTYDALVRLTQSSTTGKIDDVDYSYV
jgi:hypothetical protein